VQAILGTPALILPTHGSRGYGVSDPTSPANRVYDACGRDLNFSHQATGER